MTDTRLLLSEIAPAISLVRLCSLLFSTAAGTRLVAPHAPKTNFEAIVGAGRRAGSQALRRNSAKDHLLLPAMWRQVDRRRRQPSALRLRLLPRRTTVQPSLMPR